MYHQMNVTIAAFPAPYSNFSVGAALRTTTGEIYTGKNILYNQMFRNVYFK